MASETFASRKQDLRERQSEVDAQARFLDNEGANNKEVESRIAYYDREVVSVGCTDVLIWCSSARMI